MNVPDLAVDENAPGSGPSCVFYSDSEHTLSTHAVYSFFAKKHRFIFWPLDMLKSQVDMLTLLAILFFIRLYHELAVAARIYGRGFLVNAEKICIFFVSS